MTDTHLFHRTRIEPMFLTLLAAIAIAGAAGLVIGNIVGSILVPGHDWMADTVSDLAAGRLEIIQDVALHGFAAALIALALAAAHLHSGGRMWSAMALGLVTLGLCVTIIAVRNEYGDSDNEGVVIHIWAVYAMGALFSAVFFLAALSGGLVSERVRWTSWACAILWTLGAPAFFMMPTQYDGLVERLLGLVAVVWVIVFAMMLINRARDARTPA